MSNRLSKADFIIVYMILISISFFIAGFFLGANIGQNKAEEEFSRYLTENGEEEIEDIEVLNYSHTDFVSYYYDVYLPFKEFRKEYLNYYHKVHLSEQNVDKLALTVEIRKVSKTIKSELSSASTKNTSPLLQDSHREYLLAVESIESGLNQLFATENLRKEQVTELIEDLDEFTQGQKHWLQGQTLFYESVVLWESFFVTKETPSLIEDPLHYTMSQWADLRFHQKNELISKVLESKGILSFFNPEDVLIYLDSLANHTNENSQLHKVTDAIEFLIASSSIRHGEFIEKIDQFSSITSPTIPLYNK